MFLSCQHIRVSLQNSRPNSQTLNMWWVDHCIPESWILHSSYRDVSVLPLFRFICFRVLFFFAPGQNSMQTAEAPMPFDLAKLC